MNIKRICLKIISVLVVVAFFLTSTTNITYAIDFSKNLNVRSPLLGNNTEGKSRLSEVKGVVLRNLRSKIGDLIEKFRYGHEHDEELWSRIYEIKKILPESHWQRVANFNFKLKWTRFSRGGYGGKGSYVYGTVNTIQEIFLHELGHDMYYSLPYYELPWGNSPEQSFNRISWKDSSTSLISLEILPWLFSWYLMAPVGYTLILQKLLDADIISFWLFFGGFFFMQFLFDLLASISRGFIPQRGWVRKKRILLGPNTGFVSRYAATNRHEDFAESFMGYILNGDEFRQRGANNRDIREKYNFLKRQVFYGREYTKEGDKIIIRSVPSTISETTKVTDDTEIRKDFYRERERAEKREFFRVNDRIFSSVKGLLQGL